MKRLIFIGLIFICISQIQAQSTTAGVGGNDWAANKFLGWNNTNGVNPLFFQTNALNRMKINGNATYGINGYPIASYSGYMLLGVNNNSMSGGDNIYTTKGAFSMLHLNGTGSEYQEFGYRPWMHNGITFTSNRDMAYIGQRKLSTNPAQEDITELSISWSDNDTEFGPDDMVFRFIGYGSGTTVSTNMAINNDLDGLRISV